MELLSDRPVVMLRVNGDISYSTTQEESRSLVLRGPQPNSVMITTNEGSELIPLQTV